MSAGTLQVQFPIPAGAGPRFVAPPKPAGPVDLALAEHSTTAERQVLVAKDLLAPESRQAAEGYAHDLYPKMLDNTQIFMEYGSDAVAGMNALIDQMLHEVEPVDIPELTERMKALNSEMRRIRGRYDISADPETRARYEKLVGGIRDWLGRGKSLLEMLREDTMSIEQQLDRVEAFLGGKEQQIVRNVHLYDQLYEGNEQEIGKVIGAIAVMEIIVDLASAEHQTIQADPNNPADRAKLERKRLLAEFVNNMQVKIAEYKNRLFVGWTTSPQITNMRTLDVGLAQKLDLLRNLTIPTMKGTLLQWRMLIQAQQGAQMEQAIAQAANEWLVAYANAGATVVPQIAAAVQTPTLTPQSISAMATAVEQQAQSIIDAYENGKTQRAEADDAIVTAYRVIQDATARVSDTVVNDLVERAKAPVFVEVDATPALPSGA